MKKSKISGKKTRFPSPFDITTHKTEWTCAAKVTEWINDITKAKNIPIGQAEVETMTEGDRKRVDISIFESATSDKILCVIEMKQPYFDPFDEKELKEPAREKATQRSNLIFSVCAPCLSTDSQTHRYSDSLITLVLSPIPCAQCPKWELASIYLKNFF